MFPRKLIGPSRRRKRIYQCRDSVSWNPHKWLPGLVSIVPLLQPSSLEPSGAVAQSVHLTLGDDRRHPLSFNLGVSILREWQLSSLCEVAQDDGEELAARIGADEEGLFKLHSAPLLMLFLSNIHHDGRSSKNSSGGFTQGFSLAEKAVIAEKSGLLLPRLVNEGECKWLVSSLSQQPLTKEAETKISAGFVVHYNLDEKVPSDSTLSSSNDLRDKDVALKPVISLSVVLRVLAVDPPSAWHLCMSNAAPKLNFSLQEWEDVFFKLSDNPHFHEQHFTNSHQELMRLIDWYTDIAIDGPPFSHSKTERYCYEILPSSYMEHNTLRSEMSTPVVTEVVVSAISPRLLRKLRPKYLNAGKPELYGDLFEKVVRTEEAIAKKNLLSASGKVSNAPTPASLFDTEHLAFYAVIQGRRESRLSKEESWARTLLNASFAFTRLNVSLHHERITNIAGLLFNVCFFIQNDGEEETRCAELLKVIVESLSVTKPSSDEQLAKYVPQKTMNEVLKRGYSSAIKKISITEGGALNSCLASISLLITCENCLQDSGRADSVHIRMEQLLSVLMVSLPKQYDRHSEINGDPKSVPITSNDENASEGIQKGDRDPITNGIVLLANSSIRRDTGSHVATLNKAVVDVLGILGSLATKRRRSLKAMERVKQPSSKPFFKSQSKIVEEHVASCGGECAAGTMHQRPYLYNKGASILEVVMLGNLIRWLERQVSLCTPVRDWKRVGQLVEAFFSNSISYPSWVNGNAGNPKMEQKKKDKINEVSVSSSESPNIMIPSVREAFMWAPPYKDRLGIEEGGNVEEGGFMGEFQDLFLERRFQRKYSIHWSCGCGASNTGADIGCWRCEASFTEGSSTDHCDERHRCFQCPICNTPQVLGPLSTYHECTSCGSYHPLIALIKSRELWRCKCGEITPMQKETCHACGEPDPERIVHVCGCCSHETTGVPKCPICLFCGTERSINKSLKLESNDEKTLQPCKFLESVLPPPTRTILWTCDECHRLNPTSLKLKHEENCQTPVFSSPSICAYCKMHNNKIVTYNCDRHHTMMSFQWKCGCGALNAPMGLQCWCCSSPSDVLVEDALSNACSVPRCDPNKLFTCASCKLRSGVVPFFRLNSMSALNFCATCQVALHPRDEMLLSRRHIVCLSCHCITPKTNERCCHCSSVIPSDLSRFLPSFSDLPWTCHGCGHLNNLVYEDGESAFVCSHCEVDRVSPSLFSEHVVWDCKVCGEQGNYGFSCKMCYHLHPSVPTGDVPLWRCGNVGCKSLNVSWSKICSSPNCTKSKNGSKIAPIDRKEIQTGKNGEPNDDGKLDARRGELFQYSPWKCGKCLFRNSPVFLKFCCNCHEKRPAPDKCGLCKTSHITVRCPSWPLDGIGKRRLSHHSPVDNTDQRLNELEKLLIMASHKTDDDISRDYNFDKLPHDSRDISLFSFSRTDVHEGALPPHVAATNNLTSADIDSLPFL